MLLDPIQIGRGKNCVRRAGCVPRSIESQISGIPA
ncbi:MAG: hypothetical protein ACI87E_003047, partial [Mariniblastus sp.]